MFGKNHELDDLLMSYSFVPSVAVKPEWFTNASKATPLDKRGRIVVVREGHDTYVLNNNQIENKTEPMLID